MSIERDDPSDAASPGVVLRQHAHRLNGRSWRWPFIGPEYHMFADGLFWVDEAPPWWGLSDLENALRWVWHYRTGLILGQSREGAEFWELGKQLFPRWVGFHPSRCRPDRRHIVRYRVANIASIRCLNELLRDSDAEQGASADGGGK